VRFPQRPPPGGHRPRGAASAPAGAAGRTVPGSAPAGSAGL